MFSISNLTPRQAEILEFLQKIRREERSAPTYREIAEHFGFKSTKAAADHVCALERKGYVRRHGGRSRGIELLSSPGVSTSGTVVVPILGDIPAGCPEEKAESQQGSLTVDPVILGAAARHRLFAVQVSGESMVGRGIQDGDWVVADADASSREGDVVVALIDGENTLKTLARQKGRFFLKAENPSHSDRTPLNEMMVQGVVKAVIRRM